MLKALLIITALFVALQVVILAVLFHVVNKFLMKRTRLLQQAISNVSQGEFSIKVVEGSAAFGLSVLERAFNKMTDTLDQRIKELLHIAERSALLANATQELVWDWKVSNDVLWVNENFAATLGSLGKTEWLISHWRQAIHAEDKDMVVEALSKMMKSDQNHWSAAYRLDGTNGKVIDLLCRASMSRDDSGRVNRVLFVASDITEQKRAREQLRIFEYMAEASPNGILLCDATQPDLPIVYANSGFARLTGYAIEEVMGHNCRFLNVREPQQDSLQEIRVAIKAQRPVTAVVRNYRKDGSLFLNQLSLLPIFDARARLTHYIGLQVDGTFTFAAKQRIAQIGTQDLVSGLLNRKTFEEQVEKILSGKAAREMQYVIVLLSIDRLNIIGDALGRALEEELVRQIATRLMKHGQPKDLVARYGEEEFILLLEKDAQKPHGGVIPFLTLFNKPFELKDSQYYLTLSAGVSEFPKDAETLDRLMKYADLAVKEAKVRGGNTLCIFENSMDHDYVAQFKLEGRLRYAIEHDELFLQYQPQIDIRTGQIKKFEALVRWRDPERGIVPPGMFIPVAEESGLILEIGQWVLREACRQNIAWRNQGLNIVPIAVNTSVQQFSRRVLMPLLRELQTTYQFDTGILELEIKEGTIPSENKTMSLSLQEFRQLGITASIDDFGTGNSNLSSIKRMPIDGLKIDQSFVRNMAAGSNDEKICENIIGLANSLGMIVVAQGVETEAQARFFATHHCQFMQGYFFSGAIGASEAEAMLREGKVFAIPR